MNWDEIKNLNPKDIGIWPAPAKFGAVAILFLALVGLAYYFGWSEQNAELGNKINQESTLRQEYSTKKSQAINLDLYVEQLKEVEQQFGALLRQLPSASEMESLLTDVSQAGLGRGLQFDLFKSNPERLEEFYAELPVNLEVTGSYNDLSAFTSDVSQLSRIVTLNDISVEPKDKDGKDTALKMKAVAKTFRYLDEEEVAKQRQLKEAQKKGAKK